MNKKELLSEYIMQDIVAFIVNEKSLPIDEAMKMFYNSKIFEKLQDFDTGLYLEGSYYVYELLNDELKYGDIVQEEV